MNNYKLIDELEVGDELRQVFLISSIRGFTTKQDKPYTRLGVKDKSESIEIICWNLNHEDYPEMKIGEYASIPIKVQEFRGNKQVVASSQPMMVETPDDISFYE